MKKQKSAENENDNKGLRTKGGGGGGDESFDVDEELFSLVSTVVQWYLVLEEVGSLTVPSVLIIIFSPLRLPQTAPVSHISSPAKPSVSATKPRKSSRNAQNFRAGWSRSFR